jgi:hypothetical protein
MHKPQNRFEIRFKHLERAVFARESPSKFAVTGFHGGPGGKVEFHEWLEFVVLKAPEILGPQELV